MRWWLVGAFAAGAVAATGLGRPPALDEESYLDLARQVAAHLGDPYGWRRTWQPWGPGGVASPWGFAHPPFHWWGLALLQPRLGDGAALRAAWALPWAVLLGGAAGSLASRFRQAPLALVAWVVGPVVVLGLQLGLMSDLPAAALLTAGLAAWLGRRPLLAGALLGLAACVRYPSLLAWPPLILHARRRGRWAGLARALIGLAATWGLLEACLAARYGGFHLLHVLGTAGEIARGPAGERALGLLARLGVACAPLALLRLGRRRVAVLASLLLLGVCAAGAGSFRELASGQAALLAACAALGSVAVAAVADAGRAGPDRALLAAWVLLLLGGIVIGHNYAAPRYLLPAMLPLSILLAEPLRVPVHRRIAWALVAVWAVVGVTWAVLDGRQVRAMARTADVLAARHVPAWFTGEWTVRWRLARSGWRPWYPGASLGERERLAVPLQTSSLPVPRGRLLDRVEEGAPGLRLLDVTSGIGWHAETLGPLPFGWGRGPLERIELREIAPAGRAP